MKRINENIFLENLDSIVNTQKICYKSSIVSSVVLNSFV